MICLFSNHLFGSANKNSSATEGRLGCCQATHIQYINIPRHKLATLCQSDRLCSVSAATLYNLHLSECSDLFDDSFEDIIS